MDLTIAPDFTNKERVVFDGWYAALNALYLSDAQRNAFKQAPLYNYYFAGVANKEHPTTRISNYTPSNLIRVMAGSDRISVLNFNDYDWIVAVYCKGFIAAIQDAYNVMINTYPENILKSETQAFINQVTGSDKLVLQNSFNSLVNSINTINNFFVGKIAKGENGRVGTTIYGYSWKWSDNVYVREQLKKLTSNLISMGKVLIALQTLKVNAQNVILQQEQAREVLRREAVGLVIYAQNLLAQVQGTPKIDYSNELAKLIQMDYVPQIEGIKVIIAAIENTLKSQIAESERLKMESFIEQSTNVIQDIGFILASITNATIKNELTSRLDLIKQMVEGTPKVDALNLLRIDVLTASKKESYDSRVRDANILIGKLPKDLADSLYAQLKFIVETTEYTVTSLTNGLDKLNDLIPQVETRLAEMVATSTQQYIETTEQQRTNEINNIITIKNDDMKIKILSLKQEVNSLLPQLPPLLNNVFTNSISDAELFDDIRKLAFYEALVFKLKYIIANAAYYENASVKDLTGLSYELNDSLQDDASMLESDVAIKDVKNQSKASGGGLALLLSAGLLLFNFL